MTRADPVLEEFPEITGNLPVFPPKQGRGPIILQVFGASGSGKTTLVRQLTESWGPVVDVFSPDYGKRPVCQVHMNAPHRPLVTVGHYYVACGGADTIKHRSIPYQIAVEAYRKGYDVLLEGIFISLEFHRVRLLQEQGFERKSVFLDIPMDVCEESVQLRREAAGKERRPLKQMADTHPRIMRTYNRLHEAKVPWLRIANSRESGLALAREALKP